MKCGATITELDDDQTLIEKLESSEWLGAVFWSPIAARKDAKVVERLNEINNLVPRSAGYYRTERPNQRVCTIIVGDQSYSFLPRDLKKYARAIAVPIGHEN